MDKVKDFILDYIQREYSLPECVDPLSFNYIDSGYIDSLGLLQFIAVIEDEFSIEFSDDDMKNPKIKIIGGLIEMIEEKMG